MTEGLSQEAEEVKADMEALETRIRQELEDKHVSRVVVVCRLGVWVGAGVCGSSLIVVVVSRRPLSCVMCA